MLKTIVVVFKTHFDLGFTDLPDRVMAAYTGPMFDAVQAVMAADRDLPAGQRYTWTLPAWALRYFLDNPAVPSHTRAAADKLVRAGRLTWHAWPFTTHTAFCGLEDLVRGLHIGRDLAERYGHYPLGAKQTDVPGHTWALPSLLVRAGVKFLHLGCNSGSSAPQVPQIFFWEGPDGERLLTFYSTQGYGTSLLPPPDWPLDTWLSLQQTSDNHGPHSREQLSQMRETIAAALPGVDVVFGELGDFAARLYQNAAQLQQIPVVPCDLADTWIHGVGTYPLAVQHTRELRARVAALESLAALLDSAGDVPGLAARIAPHVGTAYDQLLLFGEHTWGLDVKSTIRRVYEPQAFQTARGSESYQLLQRSWDAKQDYVKQAALAVAAAERELLPEEPAAVAEGGAVELLIYQPLGSAPAGPVCECRLPDDLALPPGRILVRDEQGKQIEGAYDGRVLRFAPAPANFATPITSVTLLPAHSQDDAPQPGPAPNVVENQFFRIEVDPRRGAIVSLFDKRLQREWVDNNSPEEFGAYRYDIYSPADIAEFLRAYGRLFQDWFVADFGKTGYPEDVAHYTGRAGDFTLAAQTAGSRHMLLLTGGRLAPSGPAALIPPTQEIDISLSIDDLMPVIDLEYRVRGKAATPFAESAVVGLPLNLPKPQFRLGQVGSVIDPARDIAAHANHSLWCVDRWVDASDDRYGCGVIPLDMPLVSIGTPGVYEYQPTRTDFVVPLIYAHLFNTQWGTNFPQWLEGDFRFGLRLYPHRADWRWRDAEWPHSLVELAAQTCRPALALPTRAGALRARQVSGWRFGDGMELLALYPHSSGGWIARIYDQLGLARTVALEAPFANATLWRCDLLDRAVEELPSAGNATTPGSTLFQLAIRPHAVETLLFDFAGSMSDEPGR